MKIRPEEFDILGLFTFPFIALLSLHALITGEDFSKPILFILLFIGLAGLLIDGWNVYFAYFRKRGGR